MSPKHALLLTPEDPDPKEIRALADGPISHVIESKPGKTRRAIDQVRLIAVKGEVQILILRTVFLPGIGHRRIIDTLGYLHRCGVEIRSIEEPWLSLGSGVGQFTIEMSALAASERRENIAKGMARARKRPGRPRVEIPPEVYEMADRGLSLRAIARKVGLGASTIQRALAARRVLQGHTQVSTVREVA